MTTTADLNLVDISAEPGFEELHFARMKRRAACLSEHRWRFYKKEGPRGIYYEGFGPAGRRVMSEQNCDPRASLAAAINHAFDIQFP